MSLVPHPVLSSPSGSAIHTHFRTCSGTPEPVVVAGPWTLPCPTAGEVALSKGSGGPAWGAAGEDTSGYVGGSMAMLCTELAPMQGETPGVSLGQTRTLMLSWALPVPGAVQPVHRAFEAQLGPPYHSGL